MNLLCRILGHKWITVNTDMRLCERCREVKYRKRPPVSTLDAIIHDHTWYRPRKK